MSAKPLALIGLFVILSFISFSVVHHQSFSSSLRYSRVAEGHMSKVVRSIWKNGYISYAHMLRYDAKGAGRIRPIHWLYYNIPFALTMIRNGDLFRSDETAISDRINGDLQTHTFFLAICLSVAVGLVAYLIFDFSGLYIPSLLFLLCIFLSLSVCENLLIYYCDSQEIPQLLFLSCYLFSINKVLKGKLPSKRREVLSYLFLALAYGVKETTLVLMPVMVVTTLFVHMASKAKQNHQIKPFLLRHLGIHLLYTLLVTVSVWWFLHSGTYVAANYKMGPHFIDKINMTLNILTKEMPILQMLIVGSLFALFCRKISPLHMAGRDVTLTYELLMLLFISSGIFLGFTLINLPWNVPMIKYYLPVVFFALCSVFLIQALVFKMLSGSHFRAAAILWMIGSSIFMLKTINNQRINVSRFYAQNYAYRKAVPVISQDIASQAKAVQPPLKVLIVAKRKWRFVEGALPFLRHTNQLYGINIYQQGNVVQHVRDMEGNTFVEAIEANYFRLYPEPFSVEVDFSQRLPDRLEFDIIYVLNVKFADSEKRRIKQLDFVPNINWGNLKNDVKILKYSRKLSESLERQPLSKNT